MNRVSKWILPALLALSGAAVPSLARAEKGPARATAASAPSAAARLPAPAAVQGSCNLNTADATQLALLPGIGPVRAQAIIAHRQKQAFKTVEDLVKVKGIGRKTFARLRPYVTVTGNTTIARTKAPSAH